MTLTTTGGAWPGPGCWYAVKDEEAPAEESISVAVLPFSTSKAGLSTEVTHSCDICDSVLKDILHLDEHQRTYQRHKAYTCDACGRQFWFSANFNPNLKHYIVERPLKEVKAKPHW